MKLREFFSTAATVAVVTLVPVLASAGGNCDVRYKDIFIEVAPREDRLIPSKKWAAEMTHTYHEKHQAMDSSHRSFGRPHHWGMPSYPRLAAVARPESGWKSQWVHRSPEMADEPGSEMDNASRQG
jgi:hypothetical protein